MTRDPLPPSRVMSVAPVMMIVSPAAASGVRLGRMPNSPGRIRPSAPSTSQQPMNWTNAPGSGSGICARSTSMGVTSFMTPARPNTTASRPWMVHRTDAVRRDERAAVDLANIGVSPVLRRISLIG